jgi:predicted unusual protein kinase regulating ubiquinone biosynthesis (AarF/ABC1/UbiB family)
VPVRSELPPAVAALVDAALALVRRAPSARIAIVRGGEVLEPEALHPVVREAIEREVAAASSVCEPLDARDVEKALEEAWGRSPGKVLDELDPEPLAVRPAAQVHRAEHDGAAVAVKVRRPGVERSVRNDLALLDVLGGPLGAAFPRLDAGAVLREVREQALDELDFEHEASTLRRVGRVLREIDDVTAPRPLLDLATPDVLVTELLDGETLAAGARPADPGAAARALAGAFRAIVLDAGLAPFDIRASHVLVRDDGSLGLLGLGVARPVDRERARLGLDGLAALRAGDEAAFGRVVSELEVLPSDRAGDVFAVLRAVGGELADGPATLDAGAIRALGTRAARETRTLAGFAMAGSPRPEDLPLARMLGQLVAVLARLGATEDWAEVALGTAERR